MKRAGQLLAVLCVVGLVMALSGCGSNGSPSRASVNTAAAGGIPGKPPKPPDEPEPPPDGDPAIAFTLSHELWVMDADGTNRTKLVGDADVGSVSWSPDGLELVFSSSYVEGRALQVVSRHGGAPRLLVAAPPYGASGPAWCPLGDRIAYDKQDDEVWGGEQPGEPRGEIRAIDPQTGGVQTLYRFSYPVESLGGLSWSPDGTRLTVATWDDSLETQYKSSLAMLDLGTGELQNLTRPWFDWVWGQQDVDWAHTSDRIAFYGRKAGEDHNALWILDLDKPDGSGRFRKLTEEVTYNCSPSWSPDDSRLVIRKARSRGIELSFVDVETGALTPVPAENRKERVGSYPDWRRF